jgi:hypothetical protein
MSDLVSLDGKRQAKAPKCDFCGQPEHIAQLACPRIRAVTYETDDSVTVELWPIDDEPKSAA